MNKTYNRDYDIAQEYIRSDKTLVELSKKFNISVKTIQRALRKNNIVTDYSRNNRKLSMKESNNIRKLYLINKLNMNEIAKIYKVSLTALKNLFHRAEIKTRTASDYTKVAFNENFFDNIDTEQKAYFLGLLMADGNIYKNNVRLLLQDTDRYIIEYLQKLILFGGKLYNRKSKNNRKSCTSIVLNSRKMCESLERYGCVPNKSLILQFPSQEIVPKHFIHHFIRGYFDGDGCISLSTSQAMTIVSTNMFLSTLSKILESEAGIKIQKLENHPNNMITKRYRITGKDRIGKFYNFIYNNATIFMTRKKEKFEKFLFGGASCI